ncbi:rRNA maturation RNase YbeY [Candidatus Thiosymbion oneisti]|uniref:rRNA maturation RNase YbeY n=1 Tax=Candidatus Thiosymbion oneisti TaxID=589554 RepID=UPI000B7CD912
MVCHVTEIALELDIQNASATPDLPGYEQFHRWAAAALAGRRTSAQLSIRLVDESEGADLNRRFRGKCGATNVLSFPYEPLPGMVDSDLIGDLVICAPLVVREARAQGTPLAAHWAHLVVHGVLHLLGYDHADTTEAIAMEGLERHLLLGLGFTAPYEDK